MTAALIFIRRKGPIMTAVFLSQLLQMKKDTESAISVIAAGELLQT